VIETKAKGATFYIDFERIREHGGHAYYWRLDNFVEPQEYGAMSVRTYYQADCEQFRYKWLNFSAYPKPMGEGISVETVNEPAKNWRYPPPDSIAEVLLKNICDYVELSEENRQVALKYLKEKTKE
jgi:hypothetical protein